MCRLVFYFLRPPPVYPSHLLPYIDCMTVIRPGFRCLVFLHESWTSVLYSEKHRHFKRIVMLSFFFFYNRAGIPFEVFDFN